MITGRPTIRVTIVCATADRTLTAVLELPEGSTVSHALAGAVGTLGAGPIEQWADHVGVFGQRCELTHVVRDGDRVEIYRPLAMDAKSARRLRAKAEPGPRKRTEGEGRTQR